MAALSFASALAFAIAVKAQVVLDTTQHPSGLSNIINPSFAGMGIEPSNLFSFTGGSEGKNVITYNCLQNLAGYSGTPPHLRIGGNTGDNILYNGTVKDWRVVTNPNPTGIGAYPSDMYYVGDTFFEGINRLPAGTPITFGLNLAYENSDYLARIVEQAATAVKQFTNVKLVSFEVGNEPDLYLQNGFRTGSWNGSLYSEQWTARTNAVYEQVLLANGIGSNFFEPGTTANTIGTSYQIGLLARESEILEAANATTKTTYVAQWNQHDYFYYVGVSGYTLTLNYLMDLSQTPAQFAAWTAQISQAYATGYGYALREMASVGPIGAPGISDVFGATLWQLNFFLYTASLNLTSVQMHMTDNSYAAPWQPIPNYNLQPYVRSTYYAWAAMAQIIGKACNTRVAPLSIGFPQNYANRLGAYAIYQSGNLASVVLLNTLESNASTANKNYVTFNVSFPGAAGQTVFLSYLTADGADSTKNTTWNGVNYEQTGTCQPTVQSTTTNTTTVSQYGYALISVRDSQAVVANLGSVVGSGAYNATACSALGLTLPAASETASPSTNPTAVAAVSTVVSVASSTSVLVIPSTSATSNTSVFVVPITSTTSTSTIYNNTSANTSIAALASATSIATGTSTARAATGTAAAAAATSTKASAGAAISASSISFAMISVVLASFVGGMAMML